jgi:hypothetical protein
MMTLRFSAEIQIVGINPYVHITPEQADTLRPGWRRPMPVIVRVNGEPRSGWHINLMPVGDGSFYLYLAGIVRKASATQVGDTVSVAVGFDPGYLGGPEPMPGWFGEALEGVPRAKLAREALSPSRQKEIVRYMFGLKSQEARARNAARALSALSGDSSHFMGRDWTDGR